MGFRAIWLRYFNWLLLIQGLVIICFAAYIAATNMASFVYVLGGTGIYICLTALVGIQMIGSASQDDIARASTLCVKFYAILFFVLLLLHSLMVIGFLFFEDKTIQYLQDLNSHGDNEKIRNYLDNHRDDFKYAGIAVLSVELITFILAITVIYSSNQKSSLEARLVSDNDYLPLESQVQQQNGVTVSATPQTDARRKALSEKYGGLFERSQNGSSTVGSTELSSSGRGSRR